MGKTGQMHEVEFRLFVSTPLSQRSSLVLRPAGVDCMSTTVDLAPEQRAISLSVDPGSSAQRSMMYDDTNEKAFCSSLFRRIPLIDSPMAQYHILWLIDTA
jgi:hypothetical protein